MSINCPVFESDDRVSLDSRLGLMLSVVQDRMDDANEAWISVQESHEEKKDKLKKV